MRRIRDDNISVLQQLDALWTPEVSVTLKLPDPCANVVCEHVLDVQIVRSGVAVVVLKVSDFCGVWCAFLWWSFRLVEGQCELLMSYWAAGVACGCEFGEGEIVEEYCEVLEEFALVWVVAVAEDFLAPEVSPIVSEFFCDVGHAGVELVLLGFCSAL